MNVDTGQWAALRDDVAAANARSQAAEAVVTKLVRTLAELGGPDLRPVQGRHRAPRHLILIKGGRS